MNKKLSKYISLFDYFDKFSIVLSVTSGSASLASFASVIGIPIGIISLAFSLCTGFGKKILKGARKKKQET